MRLVAAALALGLLVACGGPLASPSPGTQRLTVVTTTTVLADFVTQVTGDRADVHALVPRGADPHTFDPTPSDAIRVSGARLLVMNGLGLDDWLVGFIGQAGAEDVRLVELAADLPGVTYLEGGEHDDVDDHAYNPHLWLNVNYARLYVQRIADELSAVDPAGEPDYRSNAAAYDVRLAELDAWIGQSLAAVPESQRRVVSFHDAFPYFAEAYGVEIIGVLVEVPGQEPSAAEIARLIDAIRATDVRVILAEDQFSDQLAQAIARETSATVLSHLHTDSLGTPPADTFEGAMRSNVEQIIEAFR